MKKSINDILVSFCAFAIGIFLVIWASSLIQIASIVIGSFLILSGIINIVNYYKYNENKAVNITSASVKIVLGAILVLKPDLLSNIISFIIGIVILLSSVTSLSKTLGQKDSSTYKTTLWLSLAGIFIGILCIIGKFIIPNLILQFIGVMLIIYSIINLIDTSILNKQIEYTEKDTKKEVKIIDVKEED